MVRIALILCLFIAPAQAGGIVSIGGSTTEIVYALGAGDRLVAADSTSLFPPKARELPDVGYMRQLSAEPIIALDPDLVLAEEDAGPPRTLDQLRAAGVDLTVVPDEPSAEGVLRKVEVVARALGLEAKGRALAARLEADFDRIEQHLATAERKPEVLFLLSIGSGAPLAAGRGTSAAGIIALAGGQNAVNGFDDYKPLTPEAVVTAAPDFVLVTRRTLQAFGGMEELLARPELSSTPAGREGRLIVIDGLSLLGFGPRTPAAIRELAGHLHPELSLAPE